MDDHPPYYTDPDGTTGPLTAADIRNRMQRMGMWEEVDMLIADEFNRKDNR